MPIVKQREPRKVSGLPSQSSRSAYPEDERSARRLRLEDFIIVADVYEFPIEDKVPHGYYHSEIKKLDVREKNGKGVLDVSYEICAKNGRVYYIKQSYPEGSKPLKDFYRGMVAAGVKPGPNLKDTIGVREIIAISYVSKDSDFGSIVKRIPEPVPNPQEDEAGSDEDDDDFCNFLPDDED